MPDLNLLVTLDVLLSEGSVAGAARRLRLSPSAMSRALARLREVTGDPLLVRAGRRLVPSPRAIELRAQVGALVEGAQSVLRPAEALDLGGLRRQMTLRASEGFAETFGPQLLSRVGAEAPGVVLHFQTKPDKDSAPLRAGEVDLETAVLDAATAPELRAVALFDDRWVAVVREGHPLTGQLVSAEAYAGAAHVAVVRRGLLAQGMDEALAGLGLDRRVVAGVSGFASAIALARQTDLVATVPERHTEGLRTGVAVLPLPFALPPFTLSLLWHPRMEGDLAHRWLRDLVVAVCGERRGRRSE
ncbi:LysR family transcriptional regulator [Neotabrizicola shimadae]|uniref:LysR family transcriptional regulator n=1 Tax=Neotabrizicola shimadae TaxID=2807096 RepID=A0A8G0ZWB0_9RHOB|nr:LysR family transcriptional regulator [Neotabrizicola shimadae]QYZ70072.1 LysR family transcriptional regulator [Neotabrizicola shimadae]